MKTIPDTMLDAIVEHRPHLAPMIANLRTYPDQAAQIEQALARAYLYGAIALSALDTLHLSQVANGSPWGGDWVKLHEAAHITGYTDAHLRRLAAVWKAEGKALKRDKTWYVKRDVLLPHNH